MSKHTKGPWKLQSYRLYASQMAKAEYPVHAPKRGLIAKAYSENDARLIAASPDLYAVLKELQESAQYWSEYDVPLGIVDRINQAIAKAEGA